MTRLVVYVRSSFCPDVARWRRWVAEHPLEHLEIDIDRDDAAYEKVLAWTGHESVPTLVIAPEDGLDPVEKPAPLPGGRRPRAVDRGTMLTEPNPSQIGPFLERHGIAFGGGGAKEQIAAATATNATQQRPWWRPF